MTFLFAKVKKKRLIRNQPFFRVLIFGAIIENMLNVFLQSTFSIVFLNSLKVYSCNLPQFKTKKYQQLNVLSDETGNLWQNARQGHHHSENVLSWLLTNKDCVYLCAIRAKSCAIDFQTKSVLTI